MICLNNLSINTSIQNLLYNFNFLNKYDSVKMDASHLQKKSQSIKLIFNVLPCLGLLNYRNITKQQRTKSLWAISGNSRKTYKQENTGILQLFSKLLRVNSMDFNFGWQTLRALAVF